jgi:hypothetical protein
MLHDDFVNDEQGLEAEIRRLHAVLDRAVTHQLSLHPDAGPAAAVTSTPRPPSNGNGHAKTYGRFGRSENSSGSRNGQERNGRAHGDQRASSATQQRSGGLLESSLPKDGPQIWPWMQKQANPSEIQEMLEEYGAEFDFPGKFKEWDRAQTGDAIAWLLGQLRGEAYE